MRKLLSVKRAPVLAWSSQTPLTLRPRLVTFFYLSLGLALFGFGEALLIASGAGVSPWTVLAQGIAGKTGWSIGISTGVISIVVLLLWIPLRQRPGIATILNVLIVAVMIDYSLPYLPVPQKAAWQLFEAAAGVLVVGIGSGIYLTANLGTGPRDGLMTGLQKLTGLPIATVRVAIEVTVVSAGWYLGGVVGLGTVIFALGVGACVAIGIFLVRKFL